MSTLAEAWMVALGLLLLLQTGLTVAFMELMRRRLLDRPWLQAPAPSAEVVLCLRGADPTLPAALEALAKQMYPGSWRLLVMVDSLRDPAWAVTEDKLQRLERDGVATWQSARMFELNKADPDGDPAGGSLKCMALRQAFRSLDVESEVVALVDADAVVSSDWLAALSAGCCQPQMGAVWGNRWFAPGSDSLPGEIRAIWNLGALVMMALLEVPWGGSLAVRRSVITNSCWGDLIRTSFGEDTALPRAIRKSKLKQQFRPELIVVDHDPPPSLRKVAQFLKRQLVSVRVSHGSWPLIATHAIGQLALFILAAPLVVILSLKLEWLKATEVVLAFTVYELGCSALCTLVERVCRTALQDSNNTTTTKTGLIRRLIPLALTQWLYGVAIVKTIFTQQIEWRGVTYRVYKNGVVQL